MSTYILSDIHGDIDAFEKMLKEIDYRAEKDFLIINGDVLDRGEHGVELLLIIMDMVKRNEAIMLKGNHELFAQMYLEGTMTENMWVRFYGEASIKGLNALEDGKKAEVLDFIKNLPLYMEREVPGLGQTVITHSGLKEGHLVTKADEKTDVVASIVEALEDDEYELLTSADIHYWPVSTHRTFDKYIICGHQPTFQLGPEYLGKIYRSRYYMDIDAGAGNRSFGGKLACLCLDDGKEFYI